LYVAIEAMLNLHSKIICVVLQVWFSYLSVKVWILIFFVFFH
jgi:hypothetical protein